MTTPSPPPVSSASSPTASPLATSDAIVRDISMIKPLEWLARGLEDAHHGGWLSWAHGVALSLLGMAVLYFGRHQFWFLVGTLSSFLVIAPVLATSLYAISRALERGEPVNLQLIVKTWTRWQHSRFAAKGGYWVLVRFGLLLGLAALGWMLTSAALITLMAQHRVGSPQDFMRYVVLARDSYLFEIWLGLGGLMVAPIFASSVVSIPMLLDRRVTVLQAVLTSWQVVINNPGAMALWAALVMGMTALGIGSLMIGLIYIIPMLGHGSWHAYRDLVDASALPERLPPEEVH